MWNCFMGSWLKNYQIAFLALEHFKVWDVWVVDLSFANWEESDCKEENEVSVIPIIGKSTYKNRGSENWFLKTICDFVPIPKFHTHLQASVPILEDCCLFLWVSKLSWWLICLDWVNLANFWFLLIFWLLLI